jgi:hypothetical protein
MEHMLLVFEISSKLILKFYKFSIKIILSLNLFEMSFSKFWDFLKTKEKALPYLIIWKIARLINGKQGENHTATPTGPTPRGHTHSRHKAKPNQTYETADGTLTETSRPLTHHGEKMLWLLSEK